MKIIVNQKEVKDMAELKEAMRWENQIGTSAEVCYLPENKADYKNPAYKKLNDRAHAIMKKYNDGRFEGWEQIGVEYYFENWYNDGNKEQSISKNTKKLAELMEDDGVWKIK